MKYECSQMLHRAVIYQKEQLSPGLKERKNFFIFSTTPVVVLLALEESVAELPPENVRCYSSKTVATIEVKLKQ